MTLHAFLHSQGLESVFDSLCACAGWTDPSLADLIRKVARDGVVHADAQLLIDALRPIERLKLCKKLAQFIAAHQPGTTGLPTKSLILEHRSDHGEVPATGQHAADDAPSGGLDQLEWTTTMRTLALTSQRKPPRHQGDDSRRTTTPFINDLLGLAVVSTPDNFRSGTFCYFAGLAVDQPNVDTTDPVPSGFQPTVGRVTGIVASDAKYRQVQFFRETVPGSGHYCPLPQKAVISVGALFPLRDTLSYDSEMEEWSNVEGRNPILALPKPAGKTQPADSRAASWSADGGTVLGWREEFQHQDARIVGANHDIDIFTCVNINVRSGDKKGLESLLSAFDSRDAVVSSLESCIKRCLRRSVTVYFATAAVTGQRRAEDIEWVSVGTVVHFPAHTFTVPSASFGATDKPATILEVGQILCSEIAEVLESTEAAAMVACHLGGTIDVEAVSLGMHPPLSVESPLSSPVSHSPTFALLWCMLKIQKHAQPCAESHPLHIVLITYTTPQDECSSRSRHRMMVMLMKSTARLRLSLPPLPTDGVHLPWCLLCKCSSFPYLNISMYRCPPRLESGRFRPIREQNVPRHRGSSGQPQRLLG